MKNAMLFPGQGSQRPGMLTELPEHPVVLAVFEALRSVLRLEPSDVASPLALRSTKYVQVALFVAGVASYRLAEAYGAKIDAVAGLSIGTYAAAVACGAASFEDLLSIVALRGRLMDEAYPAGYGMTAISGLSSDRVAAIVASIHDASGPVYVANRYGRMQTILAGRIASLDMAAEEAMRCGAVSAKRLDVACPSHCPLLEPVQKELTVALSKVALRAPQCPYLSNVTTRLVQDKEAIRADLQSNVAWPIAWNDGMQLLRERGILNFVEAFPGDVLSRLAGDDDPGVKRAAMQRGWQGALSLMAVPG